MPAFTKADFDTFYRFPVEDWGHPHTRQSIQLHYHWYCVGQRQANYYAPLLASTVGITSGQTVLLFGCGFNWTAEGLTSLGIEVIGIDVSDYVLNNQNLTEEAELREAITAVGLNPDIDIVPVEPLTIQRGVAGMNYLDIFMRGGRVAPVKRGHGTVYGEDLANRGSHNRTRNLMSQNPHFLISEELLNSVTDAEALQALDRAQSFMNSKGAAGWKIVHMLSPRQFELDGTPATGRQDPALNWKSYGEWRTFLNANGFANHLICPTVTANQQGIGPNGVVVAYSGLI